MVSTEILIFTYTSRVIYYRPYRPVYWKLCGKLTYTRLHLFFYSPPVSEFTINDISVFSMTTTAASECVRRIVIRVSIASAISVSCIVLLITKNAVPAAFRVGCWLDGGGTGGGGGN